VVDALWTPKEFWIESSPLWEELVALREKFISRRMNAFIGYARGQAAKYSLKGDRLKRLQTFETILIDQGADPATHPIKGMWHILPFEDERTNPQGIRECQIAGKWFGETTPVKYVLTSVQNQIKRYGKRANAARKAGGVDWKAMSHALRVSLELEDLLQHKHIMFPLTHAPLLLSIKRGEVALEDVQTMLYDSLAMVELLAVRSDLPDEVDRKFWDAWLAMKTENYIVSRREKIF
jgi:hypothetical protein